MFSKKNTLKSITGGGGGLGAGGAMAKIILIDNCQLNTPKT